MTHAEHTRRQRRRDPARNRARAYARTHAVPIRARSICVRRDGAYRVDHGRGEHARSEQVKSSAYGGAETLPVRARPRTPHRTAPQPFAGAVGASHSPRREAS